VCEVRLLGPSPSSAWFAYPQEPLGSAP
jgi:hypothetical protein